MWGDPPARRTFWHRGGLVEGRLEAVTRRRAQLEPGHGAEGGDHDLGSEGERSDRHPRRQRSVVGTVGSSACVIAEELTLDAVHPTRLPTRAVGRRDAPAVLAIAGELERVAPRVLLVDVCRLA